MTYPHALQPILPELPELRAAVWHWGGPENASMAPELWLTPREREEVATFGHARRRREWIAARIALKRLIVENGLARSPLHAEVRKRPSGQPHVVLFDPVTAHYRECACSLAHKNTLVAAAYTSNGASVGIDIERRSWRLPHLRRRFEASDDTLLDATDAIARYTVLWAFKEATSKLLGTGYACGFTRIVCRETRYGVCEISAPDGLTLQGHYLWMNRYAIAVVTNLPALAAGVAATPPAAAERPWYVQIARARRLRRLRRARALCAAPRLAPTTTPPDVD